MLATFVIGLVCVFDKHFEETISVRLSFAGTEHNTLIYYIFVGAVIAHFAEATYVLYLCDSLKFTHKCSLKWFVQTMLLGFPSTLLIRAHRNRVLKNRD